MKVHSSQNKRFFSEMVENWHVEKSTLLGLCDSLLMGLCQDQQQHPAVHTGGRIETLLSKYHIQTGTARILSLCPQKIINNLISR